MVTGLDLVQSQIRVAAGEPLGMKQRDVVQRGCAIECRINAEDCMNDFRPSPGRLEKFRVPGGPGVRVDTHCYEGWTISPHYDSMIAKLIVHRPTRKAAIATMKRALAEFTIEGVKSTIPMHLEIMSNPDFNSARVDTGWVERIW
jgi:acetyl-CoA carboxylase biotin carboxylase subunit